VLVRVTEIQAGKEPALAEVRDRVRDKLAGERARAEAQKLHDGVDDNRAAGKPLKDVAEALKLPLVEVAATSIDNRMPDGKPAIEGPDGAAIARAGFEAEIGVERDPTELADGGYAWIELVSTTPAADRPFEAVASEVKAIHLDTERRKALVDLGKKLVDRVKAGEAMAALALEVGGKAETTLPVTRGVIPQGLTQAAVTQAFALPRSAAGTTETADGKSRILFRVVEVKPAPPMTKEQRETLTGELRGNLQGDVIQSYVAALQARFGVTINQAELRRLTGAETTQ
jgi:peptidyl-prolyl cis-trans isomerase D